MATTSESTQSETVATSTQEVGISKDVPKSIETITITITIGIGIV